MDSQAPSRVKPLPLDAAQAANRSDRSLLVLSRLAPGVTLEQARRKLNSRAQQLTTSLPDAQGWGVRLAPLKEQISGSPNKALVALAGAVGLLLLIACINVATLVSARTAGQRREIAIRAALGAGRARLTAVACSAQTLLLAMLGGAGGLLAQHWSLDALVAPGAQSALPPVVGKRELTGAYSSLPPDPIDCHRDRFRIGTGDWNIEGQFAGKPLHVHAGQRIFCGIRRSSLKSRSRSYCWWAPAC